MNRVMKLKPSGGCRTFLTAFVATLASVVQLFAADAVITWNDQADITYGTPLSSTQLNAGFTNSETGAALTGNTFYNPLGGVVLNAGDQQSLKVTFYPNANQGVSTNPVEKTVKIDVNKATLTATAASATKQYGSEVADQAVLINNVQNLGSALVTYSGLVNNDVLVNVITGTPTLAVAADSTTKAGTSKAISFGVAPAANSNYAVQTVNGTLQIVKRSLVFTLEDQVKQYGADTVDPEGPLNVGDANSYGGAAATGLGWQNEDAAKVKVSIVHVVKDDTSVGVYDINVDIAENTARVLANYDVQINNVKYTVNKRPVILAVTPGASQITYGAEHPAFGISIVVDVGGSGYVLPLPAGLAGDPPTGDATKAISGVITSGFGLSKPAANAGAGAHDVTITGGALSGNFSVKNVPLSSAKGVLTILKRTLTISASDRTKVFGAELPGLAFGFPNAGTEFVFGDGPAVVSPTPTLAYDVGVIGAGDPKLLVVATYADAIIIQNAGDVKADSYNLTLLSGDLDVTLLPPLVVWNPKTTSLTYGDTFKDVDHLKGRITVSTTTNNNGVNPLPGTAVFSVKLPDGTPVDGDLTDGEGLSAGTYLITMTWVPDAPFDEDYGVATQTLPFIVAKKNLEVTANDQTRVFGSGTFNGNAITYKAADFVGADNAGSIETAPTVGDPTNVASNVGEYSIIPAGGTDQDYSFVFKSGKLTVTKKATVLVWSPEASGGDTTKHILSGNTSAGTGNANAAVEGGVEGTVVYSPSSSTILGVPGVSVVATFKPASGNFSESSVTKFLNVKRRTAAVTPAGTSIEFGDAIPGLTGTAGFLEADGIVTTFSTDANKASGVGTYFIDAAFQDTFGKLKNYTIDLKSGDENRLEIVKADLTIETQNAEAGVLSGTPVQDLLSVRLYGLKGEAAVLNGVALNLAQLETARTSNSLTIGDKTYSNSSDDLLKDLPLLGRVFNKAPTAASAGYNTDAKGTYVLKTVLDIEGNPTTVDTSTYTVVSNTNGTISVGLAEPTIAWNSVNAIVDPAAITYGTKVDGTQLGAKVTNDQLKDGDNSLGTFTYRLNDGNGPAVGGLVLPTGTHTLHLTYDPPANKTDQFRSTVKTTKLVVNKAPLVVKLPSFNKTYGNGVPVVKPGELIFGNGENNANNNFVNGESVEVFNPVNGGQQPVVTISPVDPEKSFIVGNNGVVKFGQSPSAKNYQIIGVNNGVMTVVPRLLTVWPVDTVTTFGVPVALTLTYDGLAEGETAANLNSAATPFLLEGSNIAGLAPNQYTIHATGAFSPNYVVTHQTGTLTVAKGLAGITIGGDQHVYDGTPKSVSVSTTPVGLGVSVTYNGSATAPTAAGTYVVVVTVNDALYQGVVETTMTIAPAAATLQLDGLVQIYDGSTKTVTLITTPAGLPVSVTYNKDPEGPVDAGTYEVIATVTNSNYAGSVIAILLIEKATGTVALNNLEQVANGTEKVVGTSSSPEGLDVSVTYDGSASAPTAAGNYTVVGTISDVNYKGSSTGTLVVHPAATITLTQLVVDYDGTPKSPTVLTSPEGLTVNLTYNKDPETPTDAGTYAVVATIDDPKFSGTVEVIFLINPGQGTVTFVDGTLETPWNNIKAPQVTTDPANTDVLLTYNGESALPTQVGEYEVFAQLNDVNVVGTATATFVVGKADQTITFPAVQDIEMNGAALVVVLSASATSGLNVEYTVAGGAQIKGSLLTISQPGDYVVTAKQLGDALWNPAEEKVRTIHVTGTGVPLGAAGLSGSTNDSGNFVLSVKGAPGQQLTVRGSSDLETWSDVVKMVLNGNGEAQFTDSSTGDNGQRFFTVE